MAHANWVIGESLMKWTLEVWPGRKSGAPKSWSQGEIPSPSQRRREQTPASQERTGQDGAAAVLGKTLLHHQPLRPRPGGNPL